MIASEARLSRGRELRTRYTAADLGALSREEARRFVPYGGDPQADVALAWELLYRLEPELYDRLVSAERLHRGVLEWLPRDVGTIVEVGAGTGRLTLELIHRAREVIAIEPALPMRRILDRKLSRVEDRCRARVIDGFFDSLPAADASADFVVACSVLTPEPRHGGDPGLAEMERVCKPGGCVAVVWPNHVDWLAAHGYRYKSFPGEMFLEFANVDEAVELTEIFYPRAAAAVRRGGLRRVPWKILEANPPRDLAFKVVAR